MIRVYRKSDDRIIRVYSIAFLPFKTQESIYKEFLRIYNKNKFRVEVIAA